MADVMLRYGAQELSFSYAPDILQVLDPVHRPAPLSDAELGNRLETPISEVPIEEKVVEGGSVLIVVPDATRRSGSGQIVNLLVRRLIAVGIEPFDIRVIIATGIHRKATADEKAFILTPFIYQRIRVLDHDAKDLSCIIRVGETSAGITVELNRALFEHDHVFLIGSVSFHYFAGFTGGRKLICPGLASARTISETHRLAFDCDVLYRRNGVGTGLLHGNPVHEAFVEASRFVSRPISISTLVNEDGECTELFCGDLITAHEAACSKFAENHTINIREKRDLVVASCGGLPFDINIIQAHKALEAASHACNEGGTIVLLAECMDGYGHPDMVNWFEAANSRELAERLCKRYQVNGQTAWSIREKSERFRVLMCSSLDADIVKRLGFEVLGLNELAKLIGTAKIPGYIIPVSSSLRIKMIPPE